MNRQKSFSNENEPVLYLVATPIGNLEDITIRAVRILKEVDIIYAEDTRITRVLLNNYDIKKPLYSYYEFGKNDKTIAIINDLAKGKKVALVSDAGMPIISDPGFEIVKKCISKEYKVVVIPGVNAALSGLIVSGISPHPFVFLGFLSNKKSARRKMLEKYKYYEETLVFYESPHRIKELLVDLFDILGEREMALAREITKKYEEIIRGKIGDLVKIEENLKGEMVVIVSGYKDDKEYTKLSLDKHLDMYIKLGLEPKEAIKKVASERGITKQIVYKHYHKVE